MVKIAAISLSKAFSKVKIHLNSFGPSPDPTVRVYPD